MCGKIKECKQKLSELKKYENIIKKTQTCKQINNFFLRSKKKVKPWDKKGHKKIVFRYLNPSFYIKAN